MKPEINPQNPQLPIRTISERVAPRAIEAWISNYREPQQAVLELIDNAVDNREGDKPLTVRVRASKSELSVYNEGGRGLDLEGLENFFVWGYSDKTAKEIGFYGVGGKAAMGYLGRNMEVACSAKGSDEEYKVDAPQWEKREEDEWKEFPVETTKAKGSQGYFRVRVSDLKHDINLPALVIKLGDIYRPLLLTERVTIFCNNKKVDPLEIRYVQDDPNFRSENYKVNTRLGEIIPMKVGILEKGQNIKSGIRLYYRGRLIEDGEFFGIGTLSQMPQLSRLIGEAHLDFVPVTTNKNSFDTGSLEYEEAATRISALLKRDWVEKLAKLPLEQTTQVEVYERNLAKEAKRILEHVFATSGDIFTIRSTAGESGGRLPPTIQEEPRQPPFINREQYKKPEGATFPEIGARIGENIKRRGVFSQWEVKPLGNPDLRYEMVDRGGREVLVVNSDFPYYQAMKDRGDGALQMYILETSILEVANRECEGQTLDDYNKWVNNVLKHVGSFIHQREGRRVSRKENKNPAKGTVYFNKK